MKMKFKQMENELMTATEEMKKQHAEFESIKASF